MALRVFIGNLKFAASQRELAGALEALVPGLRPLQVQIWRRGQYSWTSTCCAFVTVQSREQGQATIAAFNGSVVPSLASWPLRAEWAVPRMNEIRAVQPQLVATRDDYEEAGRAAEEDGPSGHDARAAEEDGASVAKAAEEDGASVAKAAEEDGASVAKAAKEDGASDDAIAAKEDGASDDATAAEDGASADEVKAEMAKPCSPTSKADSGSEGSSGTQVPTRTSSRPRSRRSRRTATRSRTRSRRRRSQTTTKRCRTRSRGRRSQTPTRRRSGTRSTRRRSQTRSSRRGSRPRRSSSTPRRSGSRGDHAKAEDRVLDQITFWGTGACFSALQI